MKTYVLIVSQTFPKTHIRAGERTFFADKILKRYSDFDNFLGWQKTHTIRANYELWKNRIDKVNEGKAILSLRCWTGKPYSSKQEEFLQLKKGECGIQKLDNPTNFVWAEIDGKKCNWEEVAKNDGLTFADFCDWFKVRQNKPMAVIQLTDFRY